MKITRIETIHLQEHATLMFVRVHTDEGLIGHGETKYAIDALHGFIHQYAAPLLLGQDPLQIDRHWRTIYENTARCGAKGVEMRALSALDAALWDILGQVAGMPIYQLLGGASHDRMPTYNTCAGPVYARSLNRAEGIGLGSAWEDLDAFTNRCDELAHELVEEGFKGMKIWPFDPFASATRGQRISLRIWPGGSIHFAGFASPLATGSKSWSKGMGCGPCPPRGASRMPSKSLSRTGSRT